MEQTIWQQEQRMARFDDSAYRERQNGAGVAAQPGPIFGGRGDTVYDPDDRDADWSGLVARGCKGKAGLRPQHETITRDAEGGIVARPGCEMAPDVGKKHFERDARFTTEVQRAAGPAEDYLAEQQWGRGARDEYVTAAQAAAQGEPTHDEFRGTSRRPGKRQVQPAYERAETFAQTQQSGGCGGYASAAPRRAPLRNGSLIGYRAPELNSSGPSMLSKAAFGIAFDIEEPKRAPPRSGRWNKDLVAENAVPSNAVVGYTGHRRS